MDDIITKIKELPESWEGETMAYITFGIGGAASDEFEIADLKALVADYERTRERIEWVLGACEIDRDAKNELEALL